MARADKEMEIIRVLIVDDDVDFCFVQKMHLDRQLDMECCGVAHDGKTALRMIAELKPDVVLLDHIMPLVDGLGVLEYIQEHPPEKRPRFLILAGNGQDHIINEMMRCGADYFLEKPFELKALVKRIHFVYRMEQEPERTAQDEVRERLIAQAVLAIGIPTKLLGYEYIKEVTAILLRLNQVRPTLKEVYWQVAARHGTECRCVENAITLAIKAAVENNSPALHSLLAISSDPVKKALSNGKFLSVLVQYIRLQETT